MKAQKDRNRNVEHADNFYVCSTRGAFDQVLHESRTEEGSLWRTALKHVILSRIISFGLFNIKLLKRCPLRSWCCWNYRCETLSLFHQHEYQINIVGQQLVMSYKTQPMQSVTSRLPLRSHLDIWALYRDIHVPRADVMMRNATS